MKKYLATAVVSLALALPVTAMATSAPKNYEGRLSYSMGYEMGGYLKSLGADITEKELIEGVKDAFSGAQAALTPEEMLQVKQEFAKKMQEKQLKQIEEMKSKNLAAGREFLEKNKAKPGVVETSTGLQYEIIKQGTGPKATDDDIVSVKYKGTLIDGTEFDSTAKHGDKPAQFKVDQVIPGWTEALKLMNPGTKMHLVIPSDLAYGEQGAAPLIQPNSVLVFDVDLLSIDKPELPQQEEQPAEKSVQDAAAKVKAAAQKVKEAAKAE